MAATVGHRGEMSQTMATCFAHWRLTLCAMLTCFGGGAVWGFNLETAHTLHKLGDRGTFFGFSLALHEQLTPEPQSW